MIINWKYMFVVFYSIKKSILNNKAKSFFLTCSLLLTSTTVPIVYSFKIAQITRRPLVKHNESDNAKETPYSFSTLPFIQFQKKYIGDVFENLVGDYSAFVYDFASVYYFRTDFAFSHLYQKKCNVTTFSQTECDDLLFTIGRNFNPTKKSRVTTSALFGVPTHESYILQHFTLSAGQIGTGLQLDGLYRLQEKIDFLWGTRYLYFVPANARDTLGNNHKFTIGQGADLLIALKSHWPKSHHGIEGGYSAHWNFNGKIYPKIPTIPNKTDSLRNSFYFVYKYGFKSKKYSQQVLLSTSYGFDSNKLNLGYKWASMSWVAWGINF